MASDTKADEFPCCPPGSAPYLVADYATKGAVKKHGDIEFYEAMPASTDAAATAAAAQRAVLHFPDVYGWNGGRTRALADLIADAGFRVIVPKLQPVMPKGGTDDDGLPPTYKFPDNADEILPWLKGNPFEEGSPLCTKTKASLEYLKGQGCTKIGTFGQCWGGWAATKATAAFGAEYGIYCIAIAHPSVQLEGLYGGDPAALAATAKVPTLLLPAAGDDPAMYGPEGTVFKGYQSGHADCETVLYADMVHGWTGRGDMSDEKVARDVDDAMTRSIEWLLKHWSA